MFDAALSQLYAKGSRSLSIAHEVYQDLKRDGIEKVERPLLRLEIEAEAWQPILDALAAYKLEVSEYEAALGVWEHGGQLGEKPQKPERPAELPRLTFRTTYFFETIAYLNRRVDWIREHIEDKEEGWYDESSFKQSIASMASELSSIGEGLRSLKTQIEQDNPPEAANSPAPPEHSQPTALAIDESNPGERKEPDQFITVDQMAALAGIGVPAMNNRLCRSRPSVAPITPGGRKHNAYPWPEIRSWMIQHWPSRRLPEDFEALQGVLRESIDNT